MVEQSARGKQCRWFTCGSDCQHAACDASFSTGFTRDLLLSEYKARQLGLEPDGGKTVVEGAKNVVHAMRRLVLRVGGVSVLVVDVQHRLQLAVFVGKHPFQVLLQHPLLLQMTVCRLSRSLAGNPIWRRLVAGSGP